MSSILSVTMGFLKWQYTSLQSRSARSSPKTVSTSATTPHRMKLVFIRAFIVHEICCAKSKPYTANPREGATIVCTTAQPFCWQNYELHKHVTFILFIPCIMIYYNSGNTNCAFIGVTRGLIYHNAWNEQYKSDKCSTNQNYSSLQEHRGEII